MAHPGFELERNADVLARMQDEPDLTEELAAAREVLGKARTVLEGVLRSTEGLIDEQPCRDGLAAAMSSAAGVAQVEAEGNPTVLPRSTSRPEPVTDGRGPQPEGAKRG